MRQITVEIPSGPYDHFGEGITFPERLPVSIDGREEPVTARVLSYDVQPARIVLTLELPDVLPSAARGLSLLSPTGG